MTGVVLRDVRKSFGAVEVIHGLDLEVADGEFVVFVGPSGCGKSTLLRMIAGLEEVTEGEIAIKGREVTFLDPSDRGIAMVFQNYALYPHMSVRDNLGFGLKMARAPKPEIARRISRAAHILKIDHLLDRQPGQLSGGQRQRVAIGRAIVREPDVFLFDEPLSNLDAELRVSMRVEIARLHRALGNTMIYVTHDQTEAMTLADRIVILRDGCVEQVGSPREVYEDPANVFVAGFIGSPRINLIEGTWQDGGVAVAGARVAAPGLKRPPAAGARVVVGLRPEHVSLAAGSQALAGTVDFSEYLGGTRYLYCTLGDGQSFVAEHREGRDLESGASVFLSVAPDNCRFFDADGQRLR